MGPLASKEQLAKTAGAVELALAEGANLLTGGSAPRGGAFGQGPVFPVRTIQEAVELSNDSRYGLSAYVFSRDYGTVMRSVEALQFGEIYVNRTLGESIHAHHSGYRESGVGGEDGKWGLLRYTQIKTAYHHFGYPEVRS